MLYGNNKYLQQTGASTFVNNAAIKETEILNAGGSSVDTSFTHFPDNLVTSTDSDGFLTGISGFDSEFPGAFNDSGDKMFTIETVANTYTAPAISTEAAEDVFDLDTQWDNTGLDFNVFGAADKTFPFTVTPQEITVRVVSPSAVTMSQNGTKFTRTAGYSKYSIDVVYPPMTAEQYLDYNGFINTLNGQKHPFYFNIKQNNTQLIGRKGTYNVQGGLRYKEAASAGANTILIEGFSSNQADAIQRGELLINGGYHGNIVTAASSTASNIYGEAKFRLATPLPTGQSISNQIYNDPEHIIVSLDTDTVEVSRDSAGFYYLSLTFTADNFK